MTRREREILALVAAGERTHAISRQLGISQNTVKSHLTAVYRKTGSRNRVEAVRHYLESSAGQTPTENRVMAPAMPSPPYSSIDRSRPALLQRQIEEIEARLEQLAPAATEIDRLQEALSALRRIQESQ